MFYLTLDLTTTMQLRLRRNAAAGSMIYFLPRLKCARGRQPAYARTEMRRSTALSPLAADDRRCSVELERTAVDLMKSSCIAGCTELTRRSSSWWSFCVVCSMWCEAKSRRCCCCWRRSCWCWRTKIVSSSGGTSW